MRDTCMRQMRRAILGITWPAPAGCCTGAGWTTHGQGLVHTVHWWLGGNILYCTTAPEPELYHVCCSAWQTTLDHAYTLRRAGGKVKDAMTKVRCAIGADKAVRSSICVKGTKKGSTRSFQTMCESQRKAIWLRRTEGVRCIAQAAQPTRDWPALPTPVRVQLSGEKRRREMASGTGRATTLEILLPLFASLPDYTDENTTTTVHATKHAKFLKNTA
jgi:hypothetical protein